MKEIEEVKFRFRTTLTQSSINKVIDEYNYLACWGGLCPLGPPLKTATGDVVSCMQGMLIKQWRLNMPKYGISIRLIWSNCEYN